MKLEILLRKIDPDIICLTETWFDSNVDDCEIFPNTNHQLQKRTDRQTGAHDDVLIAHESNLVLEEEKNQYYQELCFNMLLSVQICSERN